MQAWTHYLPKGASSLHGRALSGLHLSGRRSERRSLWGIVPRGGPTPNFYRKVLELWVLQAALFAGEWPLVALLFSVVHFQDHIHQHVFRLCHVHNGDWMKVAHGVREELSQQEWESFVDRFCGAYDITLTADFDRLLALLETTDGKAHETYAREHGLTPPAKDHALA